MHTRIVPDLRSRVYDKLQRLSFRFFDANATGSIINRVTSDVQSVRAFIDGVLIQFVLLLVSLVCYLAYMLSLHVGLTLACLATTPLMWLVTVIFSRMVRPMYDQNRELVDRVVLRLAESIQGVQVIKGFGREREEIARFAADNRAVRDQQHGIFWRVSHLRPDDRLHDADQPRHSAGLRRLAGDAGPARPRQRPGRLCRPACSNSPARSPT